MRSNIVTSVIALGLTWVCNAIPAATEDDVAARGLLLSNMQAEIQNLTSGTVLLPRQAGGSCGASNGNARCAAGLCCSQ